AVVNVENKENWTWFMELLISDLGLPSGEGLTIISNQHKGIIKAAKQGAIHESVWKAAKATYPIRFEKVMKEIQSINREAYKYLMDRQPESWSRAYFTTYKACDAVENGISECLNTLIVDAGRKPIINMLEDIRIFCMERLQKTREKHEKWNASICPNIRKKLEKYKDLHRHWNVILSGQSRFEVRNGYEGFKGMNGMDQWPSTAYQKPLPPIKRRMLGRPPHKRKRDAMKDDGNRTRIRTASVGEVTGAGEIVSASVRVVTTRGEIVYAGGGNVSASGDIASARGGNVSARGGKVSVRGGKVTARGGIVTMRGGIVTASGGNMNARGGKVIVSGGKVTTRGGNVSTRGGKVCARGGNVSARGGKVSATPSTSPCTPPPGFEMSTPDTAISVVRSSGGAIKLREGVWIRSPKKEWSSYVDFGSSSMNKLRTINGKVVSSSGKGDGSKSRMYPGDIRPIGFGVSWDPIDGQTMLGMQNSMGLPRHAWPEGITPQDCIIYAATQSEIALSQSKSVESQEQEPRQQQQPRQQQPRRKSERIARSCLTSHHHLDLNWIQMMQFH
ncbi:transposase, MuDR, plant, partial [Tanacetum coccineum]